MNLPDQNALRRELHNFLGNLPENILEKPEKALPGLCISLGNCLCFISSLVEKNSGDAWPQLPAQPESLADLGKKFRGVGLELWDAKPVKTQREIELAEINQKLLLIQTKLFGGVL